MSFSPDDIIPSRIYLDTGTFQAIADCGGYVFGEDSLPKLEDYSSKYVPQVIKRPDGEDILRCLRAIFAFNNRAHFDWIVSPASLAEIDAAGVFERSRYARDVFAHTNACLLDSPPSATATAMAELLEGRALGNISEKDRKLLIEAAATDCDVFLTIEKRLPKQAGVILKQIPLLVATPTTLWAKLRPHLRGL
ncbi:hypothetical protein [Thalassospira sp. HJ]|uniref:hypothetical protein n=1 Tax=Thalassospira sp. HJ TaxID=1616823 RepID=UPI000A7122D9|nr:hypothetical protein [Thalassospira sp. HJ]